MIKDELAAKILARFGRHSRRAAHRPLTKRAPATPKGSEHGEMS